MSEFLDAALAFPAFLFSSALIVTVCYWLLVLAGVAAHDLFDDDVDTEAAGIGGVPVTVAVSLLVLVAWAVSLAGTALMHHAGLGGGVHAAAAMGLFLAALLGGWCVTRLLVRPLRGLFPARSGRSGSGRSGRTTSF